MASNNEIGFTLKVDGVDRTVKSLAEMEQAIRDLTKEAKNADYGSEQFDQIRERIQTAKAAVKEFKNDTRTKEVRDQFTDLAGGVSSSFGVAEGALKSFGVESKALGTISSTANGLITTALNARQIAELKVDAATAIGTVQTKAAAAATAIFGKENLITNAILEANPIGLIVTALAALVLGMTVAVGAVKKFAGSFKPLGDAIDFIIAKARDFASIISFGLIDDAATAKTRENADKMLESLDDVGSATNKQINDEKRKLAVMEASGAKSKDLLAQKKKINQEEVASRQAAVDMLLKIQAIDGKLDDDKKKKLAELQNEIKDLNNQSNVDQAAYVKEQKDKAKELADAAKEHKKTMLDTIYQTMIKTRELNNQAKVDAIKDENEKAKELLRIQQEAAVEELDHTKKAFEAEMAERKKKGIAATAEDLAYLKSLDKERVALIGSQTVAMKNLTDQQNKALKEKEQAFQNEINDIKSQGALLAIKNARERAREELKIEEEKQIKAIEQTDASVLDEQHKQEKIAAIKDLFRIKGKLQEEGFTEEDRQVKFQNNQDEINDTRNSFEERLKLNSDNLQLINDSTAMSENDRTKAVKANAEERKSIEQAEFEYKASIVSAGMDLAAQAGQFLQQIAGKNKAIAIAGIVVEQAAAIGKIVANTAVANAKSVATFPITAGQPWVAINTISAGLSIASTIASAAKSIAQINSTDTGGGGGSNPTAPSAPPTPSKFASGGIVTGPGTGTSDSIPTLLSNGESVINANSTSMFGGLLNILNQAGGGAPIGDNSNAGIGSTPIIRTYVVASDMTNQQEADKRIKDISRV